MEYLVESSVAEENNSGHKVKIEMSKNPEADDIQKGEAVHNKDDEESEDNEAEEVSPQPKEDQIAAEEVHRDTLSKDEEKEAQIIDKEEVATESLVKSSVTEENKSDHEVKTEVINPECDDVHKGKADHLNDDEEIEGHSEEVAAEPKEDQVYEDTSSKDEEKETQIFDKEKVVAESLVESSVAEKDKSDHEVKTKATNSEAGDALKREADYINADVEIESNDPEEVAPEPKEDQILAEEVYKDTFRKYEEKQTQKIEKEKVVAESLVESSVSEKDMHDHEVKTEAKNPKAGDVHNSAENIDEVEYKKTQNELQESVCKDIIGEDKIVTQKPKEEFGAQHDFATFSTEEMKEDSCKENQKRELDSETITQSQDNGKQIAKETDSSNDCYTKSLEEEIVQESFQEDEANKHRSADTKMNKEESQKVAIPISMSGERSVAGSFKQEEWDVMEPEKETKNLEIEGAKQNNEATHSAKEGEKETVKHEGNADAAGTFRLAEGLPPRDQQSAVTEISEKMLATMESAEIKSVEGRLKQEQWDVPEPEKEKKDVDMEGTTQDDEAPHSAQDGEMETIKHEGKADIAGSARLAEGLPPREYQELAENSSAVPEISERSKEKMLDTMESTEIRPVEGSLKTEEWDVMEPENEPQHLETQSTTQNDEATHSAQEGETETVKHEVIADAAGTDRLTEGLPPGDQELAENSSAVPENSEKSKKKMLDSTESTETRSVQGTLKQEQQDVLEPEKETKDVDKQGTTQNDQTRHSAQESETETIEHEGNADTAGDNAGIFRLAEGLPQGEYQELAENSCAVPEVSEKSKEKMLDNTESTEIAATGETKEVQLQENMLLDNNTPTPEEVDLAATERNEAEENDTVRIYKHQQLSSLEDNEEIKVLAEDGSDEDSTRGIRVLDGQNDICNTLLRSEDHVASGGTLLHDTLQQNSQDPTTLPLNEQNTITAEAYKSIDETREKFEASGITTEAVLAAEPAEDKEIQKPMVGEEEFSRNNNSNSSENLSTNRQVLDLKAEDQVHQTEDTENNQTRSIAGKEEGQFSTRTSKRKLYKNDILARKDENEDRTFHNEDENYDDQLLEWEPTIKELQNANVFFVVPEGRGLKHAAEDMKQSDECKETTEKSISMMSDLTPESNVKEVSKEEILLKAEARANQDQFIDTYIRAMSDLETQTKADHTTDSGTKLSSEDEKLQLLQQGPVEKIFHPEIEMLESADTSKAVEGAKVEECSENMKIVDDSQSTAEKFGLTTSAESPKFDLLQPTEEPQQQEHVREAKDQYQNLHALSDMNSSALVKNTKDGPFTDASANDVSVPLEMEKLEALPLYESEKCTTEEADTNNCSTDSKNILQLHQKATLESFQSVGDNLEPPKAKPEEAPRGEEKGTNEEATLASMQRETSATSLSDLLRASKKEISQVANEFTAEIEQNVQKEDIKTEMAEYEEQKTDEEGEGDEEKRTGSAHDSPVTVEAPSDSDIKAAHKKSHNILSGVGSKVKHSIAKVKKAITGKSSHPKPPSPK